MTAIMGYAEMLLDPGQTPAERTSAARTIRRNGEHLLAIINDILDISKIEAQKVTVERHQLRPAAARRRRRRPRPARGRPRRGWTSRSCSTRSIPRQIQTDPLRCKQVLVNLVGNAIKFTHTGRVRISVFRGHHVLQPRDPRSR